jgi:hypothetical protein
MQFLELRDPGVDRHRQVADISEFTRYRRIAAASSLYTASRPKSGWGSLTTNTDARVIFPVLGVFRRQFPNPQ